MLRLLSCTDRCGELVQRGGGFFPYYNGREGEITPSELIVGITGALHLYHLLIFENLRNLKAPRIYIYPDFKFNELQNIFLAYQTLKPTLPSSSKSFRLQNTHEDTN